MTRPKDDMTLNKGLHDLGNAALPPKERNNAASVVLNALNTLQKSLVSPNDITHDDPVQNVLINLMNASTYKGSTDAQALAYLRTCLRNAQNTHRKTHQRHQTPTPSPHQSAAPPTPEDDLRRKAQATRLQRFYGPMLETIAQHAFSRADGRTNFLDNVQDMRALVASHTDKDQLIQKHMRRQDTPPNLKAARNAIDQNFTRVRKRLEKIFAAIEDLCHNAATTAPPNIRKAALALHQTLIHCDELRDFQSIAHQLRTRAPRKAH